MRGNERLSSRMSSVSVDDLRDDLETRSVAASHTSYMSGSRLGTGTSYNSTRRMLANISRESSKESSEESDGPTGSRLGSRSTGHRNKLVKQQSRQSELSASSVVSGVSGVSSVHEFRCSDIVQEDIR